MEGLEDGVGGPVDVGVVLVEPWCAKDYVEGIEGGDGEGASLGEGGDCEGEADMALGEGEGAVGEANSERLREERSRDMVLVDPGCGDEVAGGAGVDQDLDGAAMKGALENEERLGFRIRRASARAGGDGVGDSRW